jgi:competence protein ComEA
MRTLRYLLLTVLLVPLAAEAQNAPSAPGKESAPAAASASVLPDGPGKQIILRECTACHLPDHFTKFRHTNEEWQAIVIRMGQRVRSATKEELETVQKYLATNYPKVDDANKLNVNKATPEEIATRLGLTLEEAKALVDYRERHGTFREWGELLAIYGVDGRKIEAAKDRMSF